MERSAKIFYANFKGFQSSLFYFVSIWIFFLVLVFAGPEVSSKIFLAEINSVIDINNNERENFLFLSQKTKPTEVFDLGVINGNSLARISVPQIISPKVLGVFDGQEIAEPSRIIREYIVKEGDTLSSIAERFNISQETLLTANNLVRGSKIKLGQKLIILPLDGVIHYVKAGDTVGEIAQKYQGSVTDIVSFNELSDEADIYIGDILVIPGGKMPSKLAPASTPLIAQIPLANSYFIFPAQGKITQGIHWHNAVDIANNCGTSIYAAASGRVLKVKLTSSRSKNAFGGLGNHIAILHPNGVVTYYGHLLASLVNSNEEVYQGQRIALMGGAPGTSGAGLSTGCHLHFGVNGAKNPLGDFPVGSQVKYE